MHEAQDFLEESETLATLLAPLAGAEFCQPTQFKGWTIEDVLGHLHFFNQAAGMSLTAPEDFTRFMAEIMAQLGAGK